MRIIVAPDSFKGSLSAVGVATAIEQGILSVWPQAEVKKVPVARRRGRNCGGTGNRNGRHHFA